jgi:DNA-binding XRE family transcriptional regulator
MKKDIKIVFWQNVKLFRKNKWLSQEELAKIVNLHRTYISDIERWIKNVSLENIEKISLWLWLTISKLFLNNEGHGKS